MHKKEGENMPTIDLTISVTSILAISAIISPIVTAIINNRHQYKLKELEYKHENEKSSLFYKRGVYEDYLRCVGRVVAFSDNESFKEYGRIYPLALIYFPESLYDQLIDINDDLQARRISIASEKLNVLAPKIRTILKSM